MAINPNKTRMSLYIDIDVKDKVKESADKLGITINGFINVAINEYIKQNSLTDMQKIFEFIQQESIKQITIPDEDNNNKKG